MNLTACEAINWDAQRFNASDLKPLVVPYRPLFRADPLFRPIALQKAGWLYRMRRGAMSQSSTKRNDEYKNICNGDET